MAQSRLEKIGTIFTRVTGLLRTGAMKTEDKPVWYDVYEAFPPKLEPRFDRPAQDIPIKKIFYEEDIVRAKFQKVTKLDTYNLKDTKRETQTQQFIKIYNGLREQGALDNEQIFLTAQDLLRERRSQTQQDTIETDSAIGQEMEDNQSKKGVILQDSSQSKDDDANLKKRKPETSKSINIENLFKD